jgi:hypothetical protein
VKRRPAPLPLRAFVVLLVLAAPLLLADETHGVLAPAPMLALAALAGMSERTRWLPFFTIALGGLSELLTARAELGAWIAAAAVAAYVMVRLRRLFIPDGMAGDFACGLLCGLLGRIGLLLFMRLAAIPDGPGGWRFLLWGAPLDALLTALLARIWWREAR